MTLDKPSPASCMVLRQGTLAETGPVSSSESVPAGPHLPTVWLGRVKESATTACSAVISTVPYFVRLSNWGFSGCPAGIEW
jgi:hypothetical protein